MVFPNSFSKKDDEAAMATVVRETRRVYTDQGWSIGTCEGMFDMDSLKQIKL